jgi:uncharacterized protein (TIGR00255 family)
MKSAMKKHSRSQSGRAEKAIAATNPPVRFSPIRSMTGFARVAGVATDCMQFVLSLKSVNHRYLDLQFHLPSGLEALEMRWRKTLKEQLVRGHIDVRLSLASVAATTSVRYNPEIVRSYLEAFRAAATEHDLPGKPDLNVALRLPGAWSAQNDGPEPEFAGLDESADVTLLSAINSLNAMREQEGAALAEELYGTLQRLQGHVDELSSLRIGLQQAHVERLDQKMREILGDASSPPPDRIFLEAALLAERSDVEEEMARMRAHIAHFQELLRQGGEVGKKLDFLLQEMTREANTTLSKTGGIANRTLRITELGLAMKSEIEKAREQVQNLE